MCEFLSVVRPTGVTFIDNISSTHFHVGNEEIIFYKINRPVIKYHLPGILSDSDSDSDSD